MLVTGLSARAQASSADATNPAGAPASKANALRPALDRSAQTSAEEQRILAEHRARIEALKAKHKASRAKANVPASTTDSPLTEAQRKAKLKARHEQHRLERKEQFALDAQLRAELEKAGRKDGKEREETEEVEKD